MRQFNDADELALERLIDKYSLAALVNTVNAICYGKAEHIESNGDAKLANKWYTAGDVFDAVSQHRVIEELSK